MLIHNGIAIGIAIIVALGLITAGMEGSVQSTFNDGLLKLPQLIQHLLVVVVV